MKCVDAKRLPETVMQRDIYVGATNFEDLFEKAANSYSVTIDNALRAFSASFIDTWPVGYEVVGSKVAAELKSTFSIDQSSSNRVSHNGQIETGSKVFDTSFGLHPPCNNSE